MGYFAQRSLDVLNADLTVLEQLQQDFPQDGIGSLRSLAGAFQFSGDDVDKKIRSLSGGEKSRLAMARMLYNRRIFWCSMSLRTTWTWRRKRCWSMR